MSQRMRSLRRRALPALLALAALGLGFELGRRNVRSSVLAVEGDNDPVRIVPKSRRESKPTLLPEGEVYLLDFLQGLADSNARSVYLAGVKDGKTSVRLEKTYTRLSAAEAKKVLSKHGLYLSEDEIGSSVEGKKKVFWVQPRVEVPRKRGSLVRRGKNGSTSPKPGGESERDPETEKSSRTPPPLQIGSSKAKGPPIESGHPELRVYRRDDGSLVTWLVQFETSSRQEAEDAVSLIRANLEAAAAKRE